MEPKHKKWKSKQDYRTPKEFLDAVRACIGIEEFNWDLAASAKNTVAKLYWTEDDNALVQKWNGKGWMWLNPPFANIAPWVEKAYNESLINDAHICMLVPASVGSNWWRDYVHNEARVWFLNGRIKFVGASDVSPKDHALLIYAPWTDSCYDIWNWRNEPARLVESL